MIHDRMKIDAPYRAALEQAGLSTVGRVLGCLGDRLAAWSRSSDTIYLAAASANLAVYVKRYHYARFWRRARLALRGGLLGRSRAWNEYRVLTAMRRHGVQAVRPIAYGERRVFGFVRSCFLITEAVPDAMSLSTFLQTVARGAAAHDPTMYLMRQRILTSLAREIRDMHAAGFVHRDLFWRNVLIRPLPNREFEFYFLDASVGRRIRVKQWRREAVVRDLAALGVLAPDFCSKADQMRFIRAYLGTTTIDAEARQWLASVRERALVLRATERQRLDRQAVFDHAGPAAA